MIGEALFCAALGISWVGSALHVLWSDRPVYAPSPAELARPVRKGRLALLLVGTVVFAAALGAWATDWPRAGALGVLTAMFLLHQWEIRRWEGGTVRRLGKYVPAAACLAGWLAGVVVASAAGWPEAATHQAGWEAAAGVMAATYTVAALSKLKKTGFRWVEARNQALLIAERAYSGPAWLRRLRRAASRSPRLCSLIGAFGLAAELLFAFYVFPGARVPLTAVVIGLHVGIALLLGYVEPEWVLVMTGITVVTTT